ncbi:MAG: sulfatase-like hydrolase/transferase [Thermoanaerobaculia bacterium]|nr:sulfatase-like hydrolase/transferase [Thermoanaerobaculia bacterium]
MDSESNTTQQGIAKPAAMAWFALWAVLLPASVFALSALAAVRQGTRFGALGAFDFGLEYMFLPLSWTALRLAILATTLGLIFLVALWPLGRHRWCLAPAAALGLLGYVLVLYLSVAPDRDALFYGSPEVRWMAPRWPLTAGAALLAMAVGGACYIWLRRAIAARAAAPGLRRTVILSIAGYGLVLLLALGRPALPVLAASDEAQTNVLLISMDTLRADHLGCYGYPRDTSPGIDALAARGIIFEQAISQAPWTLPAHMTLFTGLYPSEHGLVRYANDKTAWPALADDIPLLAEVLADSGYVTAAFTGGGFVDGVFGFDRGFDLYRTDSRRLEDFDGAVQRWLQRNHRQPFFLFLHFYNAHRPYRPPAPYDLMFVTDGGAEHTAAAQGFCRNAETTGQLPTPPVLSYIVSQYDGEIRYADTLLGDILATLRRADLEDRTLVIFLSDHGEEFFEHGNCDHIKSLYEPLLRVPLIIAGPGLEAGRRVAEPVELREVPSLVLDMLGVSSQLGSTPRPLAAQLRRGAAIEPPLSAFAETCCRGYRRENGRSVFDANMDRGLVALRGDRMKLIAEPYGQPLELYDLMLDPGEERDLLATEAKLGDQLHAMLAERLARMRSVAEGTDSSLLDRQVLEQLRALGYLGNGESE